jgi:hypothetical protein
MCRRRGRGVPPRLCGPRDCRGLDLRRISHRANPGAARLRCNQPPKPVPGGCARIKMQEQDMRHLFETVPTLSIERTGAALSSAPLTPRAWQRSWRSVTRTSGVPSRLFERGRWPKRLRRPALAGNRANTAIGGVPTASRSDTALAATARLVVRAPSPFEGQDDPRPAAARRCHRGDLANSGAVRQKTLLAEHDKVCARDLSTPRGQSQAGCDLLRCAYGVER